RRRDRERRRSPMSALLARMFTSRLFWPVVMLLVLFLINVIAFPGFFAISIRDGNLYGSIIDILRNGAPTLIVAVGAISGAVACSILLGASDPADPGVVTIAILTALLVGLVCGLWNGLLVSV